MSAVSDFDEKSRFLLDQALKAVGTSTSHGGGSREALIAYLDHKWRGPGWIPQEVREAAGGRQKGFPCKGICQAMFEITRLASEQGVVLETLWMDEKGFLRNGLISWHMRNYRRRSLKLTVVIASGLLARVRDWDPTRWEKAKAVKCVGSQTTLPAFESSNEQVEELQIPGKSNSLGAPDRPFLNTDCAQVATTAASPAARMLQIVKDILQSGMPTPKRQANVIDLTDVPDHNPSSKRLREFSLPAGTVKAVLEDPQAWLDDDTIELLCSALQVLHGEVRPIRVFPLQRISRSVTAKLKKDLKEHLKNSGDIFLISNPGAHWTLIALSQMSEDVCKAAYHDSMYNAAAAERAREDVEAWMKVVEIKKKIELEFQVGAT
ncbi:hypothetical protein Neosp_015113 [[Neocosmospora] mangrovei]